MKAPELREKSTSELRALAQELRGKLFHGRMLLYTGQLQKASVLRENRREIARIETLLREREV
jgi:large subunit ribosomal protein L29